jgi:hypothetical protein
MFRELAPSTRTRLSLTSMTMGQTMRGYRPDFGTKSKWSLQSEVMGTSNNVRYSGVAGETAVTSWAVSFCFLFNSLTRATIYVIDLLMSFREVSLGILGLFLLIGPFGRPERHICKTLESVAVPCLVLSPGVENAHAIPESFKFTRPGPVLLAASWSFHRVDKMTQFPLLFVALDELGWSVWLDSFSFCSLVLRVVSSVKANLLVMANIASDVLGFFMVSLRIWDGSLSPFSKNITIDLLSTSMMMFLLLQNH